MKNRNMKKILCLLLVTFFISSCYSQIIADDVANRVERMNIKMWLHGMNTFTPIDITPKVFDVSKEDCVFYSIIDKRYIFQLIKEINKSKICEKYCDGIDTRGKLEFIIGDNVIVVYLSFNKIKIDNKYYILTDSFRDILEKLSGWDG